MTPYHKIQSIFKRDPANNHKTFLYGEYSDPVFEILTDTPWSFTEKVDGTNIRIGWDHVTQQVSFGGRTDNAQLPGQLAIHLVQGFTAERLSPVLTGSVTLYGEGYGGKIQKGSRYRLIQSFILFDVFVEPDELHPVGIWLSRDQVEGIGAALGIPVVPVIGTGWLQDGIDLCRETRPTSVIAEDKTLPMEGIVARPKHELRNRFGERVITKIKLKDFPQ